MEPPAPLLFPDFHALHGPPLACRPAPAATVERYRGVLPDPLLDLWARDGWCGYGDGLLWTVDPDTLRAPLAEWLGPEAEGAHAIVRTAFGSVFFWNARGSFLLDVFYGDVSRLTRRIDLLMETLCDDDYLDEVVQRPLFRRALKRLGPPGPDACYAFVPALPLGGTLDPKALQRVGLREHVAFLAQLHGGAWYHSSAAPPPRPTDGPPGAPA